MYTQTQIHTPLILSPELYTAILIDTLKQNSTTPTRYKLLMVQVSPFSYKITKKEKKKEEDTFIISIQF